MDFTQPISTKQQAESFLKQMIEEGYKDFGLDDWYLRAALRDSELAA